MPRHRLHRPPRDRLTLAMALVTALVFGLGLWGVAHLHDPGEAPTRDVCHQIPGTPRLDCDR